MALNREQLNALIASHPATIAERLADAQAASGRPDVPLDALVLGTQVDNGQPVVLDLPKLIAGRLLIQGNSGAGKSMLLRRLFEQAFGRIQQLLIDGEGEFVTLADAFDLAVITAAEAERVGPEALALHIRSHRYSAVLDLSDATAEARLRLVARLATALVDLPAEHWQPMLVLIDEVQALAPFYDNGDAAPDARKGAIVALAELMGRGRKRGLCGIIATQRIAETSKSLISKVTNAIIGRTVFDRDVERAGALLGFTAARASALRGLSDGEFLAIGPALAGPRRLRFRGGPVKSEHRGRAPEIVRPADLGAASVAGLLSALPDVERPEDAPDLSKRGFSPQEDRIIADGYAEKLSVRQIAERLVVAGHRHRSMSGISSRAQSLGFASDRAAKRWTEEEDAIIADAYGREVRVFDIVGLLADAGFERGRVAIQMRAITLGLTADRVKYWTEPEKAIALAGLEAGKPYAQILQDLRAAGFERGLTAIFKFAQKNGVNRAAESWRPEEIETLRRGYEEHRPVAEIAQELGRNRQAVATKASLLGLKQRRAWTPQERQILIDAAAAMEPLIRVASRIGRPYPNVAAEARRMGLSFARQSGAA